MASRSARRVALSAALATGALLRLWNLRDQVASDDELRAARAALRLPLGAIWRNVPGVEDGPLLVALNRLWLEAGQPLTELVLRLPVLLCGLALLWWLPRPVARRLGDGTALALAWLLALSPLLVLSSRHASSAAPAALLGALAAVAFLRWWLCGGRLAAALYALVAALAVAVQPAAASFVLAPWLFAAGDLCVRPRTSARPKWRQILVVALSTAGALAAFVLPARDALRALVSPPAGGGAGATVFDRMAGLGRLLGTWAGTGRPLLELLFCTAALFGLGLLWMRQRRLAVFSLVLVAGHLLIGWPAAPGADRLVALPVVLVWVAVTLAEPWRLGSARAARWLTGAAAALLVAAWLPVGPLADTALGAGVLPQTAPAFYRALPAPGPIVEAPWSGSAESGRRLLGDARLHGQRVLVVPVGDALDDPRLRLRNALRRPEDALDTLARWFVLRTDAARVTLASADKRASGGESEDEAALLRRWAADTRGRLQAAWGEPDVVEPGIVVWDLARVRAARLTR